MSMSPFPSSPQPGPSGSTGGFAAGNTAGSALGQPASQASAEPATRPGGGFAGGLRFALGYVVVIWVVHLVNAFVFGGQLSYLGIRPLDPSSLWGILTAPFLHADFDHLISNTGPGAIFAFLVGYSGRRAFWEVTIIVILTAGLGTWLFGGVGKVHIGASGLVYGWLAYLLIRGIFNRSLRQIALGVFLGVAYSGLVWGVLPGTQGVSWQGHLFGALGGLGAGMFITSDDPPALRARRAREAALEGSRGSARG